MSNNNNPTNTSTLAYQPPRNIPLYEVAYSGVDAYERENNISTQQNDNQYTQEEVNHLTIAFQYCRSIKTFAMIDLFFGFFYFFFYWPYLFANILILIGYYGAKKYNRKLLISYIIFAFLTILFRIYLFMFETILIFKLIYLIFVIIEIYIFRFIIKGYGALRSLNNRELKILRSNWKPTIIVFRYY